MLTSDLIETLNLLKVEGMELEMERIEYEVGDMKQVLEEAVLLCNNDLLAFGILFKLIS